MLPLELGRSHGDGPAGGEPPGVECEVFAYGRLPLAYSARCFTARNLDLAKDDCGFRCIDYPDGLALATQEGRPFLAINGIQTQSAATHNLLPVLHELVDDGIDLLRISPQSRGTARGGRDLPCLPGRGAGARAGAGAARPAMPRRASATATGLAAAGITRLSGPGPAGLSSGDQERTGRSVLRRRVQAGPPGGQDLGTGAAKSVAAQRHPGSS